jgi:hypothetical protein
MGKAVQQDRVESGITEDHFQHALGGWVFPEDGVDLFSNGPKHSALPTAAQRICRRAVFRCGARARRFG